MSNDLKTILSTVVIILGFFAFGFGIGGYWMWNRWDKSKIEYQQKLKDNSEEYQNQIDYLKHYNDSIEEKINIMIFMVDSLNTSIADRTAAIDSIKQEYDEQIDHINSMSHHELVEFFSNRY